MNRAFQFHKRSQNFIRTHNETLTVAAMRVCNGALARSNSRLTRSPNPSGFAEIVSDSFPVFHAAGILAFLLSTQE